MIAWQGARLHVARDVVRKTALMVENDESPRHGLCELFKRKGDFDVCGVAENGPEAIQLAGRLHADFMVADLLMPETNGPMFPLIFYSAFDHSPSERAKTDKNF